MTDYIVTMKGKELCLNCAKITIELLDEKEKEQGIIIQTMRNELKVLRKIVSEQPDYEKGIKNLQSQFEHLYKENQRLQELLSKGKVNNGI